MSTAAFSCPEQRKPAFKMAGRCFFPGEAAKNSVLFGFSMPFFGQGIEN